MNARHFIEHRRYGFFTKRVVPSVVGVLEKIEDGRIPHVAKRLGTIRGVREELREREDRHGTRLLDERVEPVPENVLHARTPGVRPQFFENADHVRDDEAPLLRSRAIEQVERKRALLVFRIEIDDVVRPMSGDVVFKKIIDELAVRIDDGNAVACGDVGRALISQERALAGT